MFAESAFDHVLDQQHVWHIFDSYSLPLPEWLTKFKIIMLLAALLIVAIFVPLAQKVRDGSAPRPLVEFLREFFDVHSRQCGPAEHRP